MMISENLKIFSQIPQVFAVARFLLKLLITSTISKFLFAKSVFNIFMQPKLIKRYQQFLNLDLKQYGVIFESWVADLMPQVFSHKSDLWSRYLAPAAYFVCQTLKTANLSPRLSFAF